MALKDTSGLSGVAEWVAEFDSTHTVLGDLDGDVWRQYAEGGRTPQYVVFDSDMEITYKGAGTSGHDEAKAEVLRLLSGR